MEVLQNIVTYRALDWLASRGHGLLLVVDVLAFLDVGHTRVHESSDADLHVNRSLGEPKH